MGGSLQNGTTHPAEISYWDKSQEVGTFEVYTAVVTATIDDTDVVNFTEQSTLWSGLVTAANGMVNGLPRLNRWVNQIVINANPAKDDINQLAVRELKLKVWYIDNTSQKKYTATLPTLDLTKVTYLPIIGKDAVSITAPAAMVTFVAAFEAAVVAQYTGNAVTIIAAEVVGRNN